ncbi:MAG: response regulator [Longimicrobiales bacterium]
MNEIMREKILLVEDDPLIRKSILEVLQRIGGYEVCEAEDGVEAVKLLQNRRFDLVITDLIMPRMDGLRLLKHIRSTSPQVPVIFMTGYLSKASGKRAFPGTECLTKPFGIRELLWAVRRCLPPKKRPKLTDH